MRQRREWRTGRRKRQRPGDPACKDREEEQGQRERDALRKDHDNTVVVVIPSKRGRMPGRGVRGPRLALAVKPLVQRRVGRAGDQQRHDGDAQHGEQP